MRILLVNKFNYLKGGADKYFLELASELQRQGHEVAKFCMTNPENYTDKDNKYFVSQVDFNAHSWWQKVRAAARIFYSFEARRKFKQLVDDFEPEIIHIHNIYHQISPSILAIATQRNIPIVMHLHDYKLLCPNYRMYNSAGICERCRGGKYYNCTLQKCMKDSYLKSFLATLEMYLHHTILKIYEKNISLYIAPSEFVRVKAVEWGIGEEKIYALPYFVRTAQFTPQFVPGDYFLYFGRLEKEKGVDVMLKAFAQLPFTAPHLKIVGGGSEYKHISNLINELGLASRVEMVGPVFGAELKDIIRGALSVIVPSLWYEVTGLVNLEASLCGKPVIAASIGGIPEAVINHVSGILYRADDYRELARAMRRMLDYEQAETYGLAGNSMVREKFNVELHFEKLLHLYANLLAKNSQK